MIVIRKLKFIGHSFIYSLVLFSFVNLKDLKTKISWCQLNVDNLFLLLIFSSFFVTKVMRCLGSAKLTVLGISWIQFCMVGSMLQLLRNAHIAAETRYAEV